MKKNNIKCLAFLKIIVLLITGCEMDTDSNNLNKLLLLSQTKDLQTIILYSEADLDGGFSASTADFTNNNLLEWVGDSDINTSRILAFTFDLSVLPANITIKKAVFRAYINNINGEPATLSQLNIQHLAYELDGSSIDISDAEPIEPVNISYNENTWIEHAVITEVIEDINNSRNFSQFFLLHSMGTNMNNTADNILIPMGDSSTNKTELVIDYTEN